MLFLNERVLLGWFWTSNVPSRRFVGLVPIPMLPDRKNCHACVRFRSESTLESRGALDLYYGGQRYYPDPGSIPLKPPNLNKMVLILELDAF